MENIIETIESLPKMLHLTPASEKQIKKAEKSLKLKFSREYNNYLTKFGAISAEGIELTGITDAAYLSVVALTKEERKLNQFITKNMYVVQDTAIDGIIIWQDENGLIYLTQYDSKPKQIATSLVDYITNYLKK